MVMEVRVPTRLMIVYRVGTSPGEQATSLFEDHHG
jgi:hypothetical protein